MKHILKYMKALNASSGMMIYVNLAAMGLISVLEGMSILLLIPLINSSSIMQLNTDVVPFLGWLAFFNGWPLAGRLAFILGLFVTIVIVQNVLYRSMTLQHTKYQQQFSRTLRSKAYASLLQADWQFFIQRRTSDLINVMTIELARVIAGINYVLTFLRSMIFTCVQLVIALSLSVAMTMFVLLSGALLAFAMQSYTRRSRNLGYKTSELAQAYLSGMTDQLGGMKDIKSNALESSRLAWLHKLTQEMMEEQLAYVRLRTSSQMMHKVSSALLISFFIGGSLLLFRSQPEQLILIVVIFSRLWPKLSEMQTSIQQIAATIPAFEAFDKLLQESADANKGGPLQQPSEKISPIQLDKGIYCTDLFFRYDSQGTDYALKGISLFIPAGKMTAIIGPSGAGKSTLIDVIMGLLTPEHGTVELDGIRLTERNAVAWRKIIGYVPQEPYLFNASIRENLLLAAPEASESEIWDALRKASADTFVKNLPYGLETQIGERGTGLSGGERQRLVLARALLRNPSVLILDEATSALDVHNEEKIRNVLEEMKGSLTLIVIAHRLSTIKGADQVIELVNGKIIKQQHEVDTFTMQN